eukprot:COSAG02_NODE_53365_length_302_cov_0.802956_1_plen_61_part_10
MCIGEHKVYNIMRSSIIVGHENGCAASGSLHNFRVTRLERVENPTLYRNYERQKIALRERI